MKVLIRLCPSLVFTLNLKQSKFYNVKLYSTIQNSIAKKSLQNLEAFSISTRTTQ